VAFRLFRIGRLAKDTMGRIICIGVFVFFAFSCFENIGMTMGIMPVPASPATAELRRVLGTGVLHGRWTWCSLFRGGPAIRLDP